MRVTLILILQLFFLKLGAQSPNVISILSAKHIEKVESAKSARDKLKRYKKFYSKDSTAILKEAEKYWRHKFDSITNSLPVDSSGIEIINDSLRSLIKLRYDSATLQKVKDSIRNKAVNMYGSKMDNISGYEDKVEAYQQKYESIKNKEYETILKSKIETLSLNRIGQTGELSKLKDNFRQVDKLRQDYTNLTTEANDSVAIKEMAKDKAEQLASDYLEDHPELLNAAKRKMDFLYKKYSVLTNSNDLQSAVKRTSLTGKPFKERLYAASNFQLLSYQPITFDFSPALGYRINTRFIVGIGGTYRQSFSDSIPKLSADVFGYKVFSSYDIPGNFFLYSEFARNTTKVKKESQSTVSRTFHNALLLGLGRKFKIHTKVDMTLVAAYNFLRQANDPIYPSPWIIRIGFQLNELGLSKPKPFFSR